MYERDLLQISSNASLTTNDIFAINCYIAKEIIEQRLAISVSTPNIKRLARCITRLEEKNEREITSC